MARFLSPWIASFLLKLARNDLAERKNERFLKLAEAARLGVEEIAPEEVPLPIRDHVLLIDVRERSEFCRGHIPNALHISRGVLELRIERHASSLAAEIIVYCGHGNRSALAAESLQRMGYSQVKAIRGGFQAWLDAGFPAWRTEGFLED